MSVRVKELEAVDPLEWNRRVESLPEGNINQSIHTEGFHLVTGGWFKPIYLVALDEVGEVVGQLLLLRGFFGGVDLLNHAVAKRALGRFLRTYIWMEGPLIFATKRFEEVQTALLEHVDSKARDETYLIKRATLPHYEDGGLRTASAGIFARLGYAELDAATFVVGLQSSPEDMWTQLKSSARKTLKKMLASGQLRIREIDCAADVEAYWRMFSDTQRRSGRTISYKSLREFREEFWDTAHATGILYGMIADTDDAEPVAGLLFRSYNGWIHEYGVAYSDYSLDNKIYGQDLIKWHIMLWGHTHGCRYYDLMGVELDSNDEKERGIYQYKAKWGGDLYRYPVFSKVFTPWKDGLIRRGRKFAAARRAT